MTKKQSSKQSTESVDIRVIHRKMTAAGKEIVSPVSLCVAAYQPTLGERIRKYLRNPDFAHDLYKDAKYWDENDREEFFDPDDQEQLSPYDDRYQEIYSKVKKRKAEIDDQRREKEKADHMAKMKEQHDLYQKFLKDQEKAVIIKDEDKTKES